MPCPFRTLRALLVGAVLAATAHGDVVHLEGGGRIKGKVVEETERVRVQMASGEVTVPRDRISRIELDADAASEPARDTESPESAPAAPPLEATPEAVEALRLAVGEDARIHRTRHWIVAYDVPRGVARRRARMLEDAWTKFYEMTRRMGLEPGPIERPLEALHFAEFEDWRKAVGLSEERVRTLNGIYLHDSGRIYVFETSTGPGARDARAHAARQKTSVEEAREKLAEQEKALDRAASALDTKKALTREARRRREEAERRLAEFREQIRKQHLELDGAEREVGAFARELDRYSLREDFASTTHEACHQIAFATGICRPGQSTWLVEGLATLYEITSPQSFLLDEPNAARLADLRKARADGPPLRLEPLVTDAVFGTGGTTGTVAYAQSWALAHFLYKTRTDQFARFVEETRPLPPGPASAAARVTEFERAFGADLATIESEWLAFLDRL